MRSLRLSTNFYDLSRQLGGLTVGHVLRDSELMVHLAAAQLQHTRFAAIPVDVEPAYLQTSHVDALLESLDRIASEVAVLDANTGACTVHALAHGSGVGSFSSSAHRLCCSC